MPFLGIRESSWHYRLWLFLHRIWFSEKESDKDVQSLCIYAHYLFWVGIGTLLLSPFIGLGWLVVKGERWGYEKLSNSRFENWLMAREERLRQRYPYTTASWGDKIEKHSRHVQEQPAPYTALAALAFICLIIACLAMLGGVGLAIWLIIKAIPLIPHAVWVALVAIGHGCIHFCWGAFIVLGWIGWFVGIIGTGLSWAGWGIKVAVLWFVGVLPIVGLCLACLLGFAIVSWIVCMLIIAFFRTKIGKKLSAYLAFKINGFEAARERQHERRKQKNLDEQEARRRSFEEGPQDMWIERAIVAIVDFLAWLFKGIWKGVSTSAVWFFGMIFGGLRSLCAWIADGLWRGKTTQKKVGDKEIDVQVLGLLPLIAQTIMGIYKGICPMVQIIRDNEEEPKEATVE